MSLPPNYSGSAFYNIPEDTPHAEDPPVVETEAEETEAYIQSSAEGIPQGGKGEVERAGLFHMLGSSGGIGLEELLILGLVLLISQNDSKDDLALLLLLLVFIK